MPETTVLDVPETLPGFPGAEPLKAAILEVDAWRELLIRQTDRESARLVNLCVGSMRMAFEALAIAAYLEGHAGA